MAVDEGQQEAADEVNGRRSEQLRGPGSAALLADPPAEADELLAIVLTLARETVGAGRADAFLAGDEPPDDLSAAVCRENRPLRAGDVLAAPLVGRDGHNLGAIRLAGKGGGFTDEDESALVQLARLASASLENARLVHELANRADELDAIYALADAVARAGTLDEIFEHALDALQRAVAVGRSSVVLFGDDGGIEFRAWRGLSEDYRRSVRGRLPWQGRAADPSVFVVDDVLEDEEVAELHEAFRSEGIRSMALVPLVQAGGVLGRFVLYGNQAGAFSPADVRVAEAMASHVAAAAHRRRAEDRVRESGTQLEAIFRSVADGITAQTADGLIVYANEAAAAFSGFDSLAEFLATPGEEIVARFEILDEHGDPLPPAQLPGRVALVEGRETERLLQYRFRDSGERRWSIVRATPVLDDRGDVRMAINVFHDLTQQRRAEERLRVLADAGRTLSSSLDVDETLAEIARLVVPAVADYCLVDRLAADGTLQHVVHVHVDEEGERTLDEIRARYPVLENPSHPVARVVATHEPHFEAERPDAALDDISLDEQHRRLYRELGPLSFLAVPLVARGRTLGAISMGTTVHSGRRLDHEDLALALELAERAALAVDNAVLYAEAQAEVAERQRSVERLRFLARASQVFASSLDVEATLRSVARLAVPAVTDWCIVYGLGEDGTIERIAVEHAGDQAERVAAILSEHPVDPDAETGVGRVIRDGQPELLTELSAEELARDTVRPSGLAEALGVEPCSLITVPLVARGRKLGAISLLSADSGRRYGEEDLALATELANRAALAADNAQLFREASESLALLDTLIGSAPVGVAFLDTELRYLRVNDRLAEINGIAPEAHVGRTASELLPDVGPDVEPVFHRVLETRQPAIDLEVRGMTPAEPGVTRDWISSFYPVERADGELLGLGIVVLEITERTRAEEQLRESEERFRMLANTIPALVWMCDEQNRCTYFNRRWLEFTGRTVEQELGERWMEGIHPDDVERVRRLDGAGFDERRPFSLEYRLRRHDGAYRWILDESVPRYGPGGEFAGYIGAAIDIDDRRRAEERARFLTEASTRVASSLDVDTTLDSVAMLAVPRIADWCSIVLREDDGSLRTVAVAHSDPERTRWAQELGAADVLHPGADLGVDRVVSTGEPQLVREISDEALQLALAGRPDLLEPVRELGLRSSLVVPLTARGGTVGALALATTRESGRTLDEGDLELAAEVARRAAVAVDNARLFHALEDQSRLTTTITDSAASALFMLDTSGRATYMNPAAEAMTGWTVDEIRDQRLHDVIHHVHADGSPLGYRDCVISRTLYDGGELRGHEDLFVRRDGTFFPVRCSATPIAREGGLAGALLEVVDVTEEKRVRAEADARAEAARALEFVGDGVFVLDVGGIVRLWNRAAEAITGLEHGDVVGKQLTDVLPVWSDIRERVPVGRVPDVSATRPETVPIEIDGRERWLSISGVAFVEGTVYAFRDLTEEYAIERLKSDFVSTVSHELRTPLAAIYGAAMTLQRTDVALGDDQRIGLLGVVAGESERLARIVNDVLWASRLDSGVLEVSIESCDAGALATAVVTAARVHLPSTIELTLAVEKGIPAVAADADKVRQVLVNLVDNAIKYSPDGGLVEVRVEAADHGVRFVVSDRGLGIPPTEHGRIFEKFFRLDPNLTRGVGGTGLGLYICRELIRRMDGRIWVESEEGSGSVFTFDLPEAS